MPVEQANTIINTTHRLCSQLFNLTGLLCSASCSLQRSNHCPACVYTPCTHKCDLILDRHEKEVPRAPVCVVDLCADMVMQGQTSSSNETLPNAASSITILPPPHPPTNTTAKVGSAWLASIYTLVVEQSACHLVVFFSQ